MVYMVKGCPCVEVVHLQAWLNAEVADISKAVATYKESGPIFAAHLKVIQIQNHQVNSCLCMQLQ
jgi:hypothetical protein